MPRKLPKTATEQFTTTLGSFEETVLELGQFGDETFVEKSDLERKAGTLRNKLIKMFETKGT
jgi:hypothetical protein